MARSGDTSVLPAQEAATSVRDEATGGTFAVLPGQIVLDAGLSAGLDLPHGCRVGACGACAVEVVEGLAACDPPDAIERDAICRYRLPAGVRLACRLTCRGDLRIRPF